MNIIQVVKLDNGYRAKVTREIVKEETIYCKLGEVIFNRKFHKYPVGSEMLVYFTISEKGRTMIKHIELVGEPSTLEETKVQQTPKPRAKKAKTLPSLSGYYISPEARLVFNSVRNMSDKSPERAVKVMMVGASGYGKTTLPRLFADLAGKSFLRMNCATVRDPEEWFGYREARDGNTVFVRSEFATALEQGNLVVVLDEFNRLEPWLHNTLFPLLDDDGCTVVHDEEFHIGPGVIVVGTINTGYKYTGTFELDEALLNRFEFILEVGAMPQGEEKRVLVKRTGVEDITAKEIVRMSTILRQAEVVCSTRTSLLVASMVQNGMTIREAFEFAVVRRIPVDSGGVGLRKKIVDLVNTNIGTMASRVLERDIFAGSSDELLPLEDASEHRVTVSFHSSAYNLSLRRESSREPFVRVRVIQKLRSLPMRLSDGDRFLSLREAQGIIEQVENGIKVNIRVFLDGGGETLSTIIDAFASLGVIVQAEMES